MTGPPISQMNVRIRIEKPTQTNDQGEPVITWSHYRTLWAAENIQQPQNDLTQKRRKVKEVSDFTIHHRRDITTDMRVIRGGTTFEIESIIFNTAHQETILRCIQENANG